jgi:hypothetical protein
VKTHRVCRWLTWAALVGPAGLGAQTPDEAVVARFGGPERLAQLGRLELVGVIEAREPIAFRLRLWDTGGRLDTAGHSRVEQAGRRSDGVSGGWMPAREIPPGWELHRLVPYGVVRELGRTLQWQGAGQGVDWFQGRRPQSGGIGYDPPPVQVELAVDRATRLPVRLRVQVPERDRDVEIVWSEWAEVAGVPVPGRIQRRLGVREERWRIQAVDFQPVFDEAELWVPGGGR